ncbi:xylulokinase [Lachnobacterium bovis]|uniref:xylulokinase n=1 Tax=Lachnobacterium bovis TaxID=140626 RepID=UPI00048AD089|nr:FGGY-family carbohydrate kinase [Lachnobacterium bovis]
MNVDLKTYIESGKAVLGIEFGSTRIKAVLIGQNKEPIASGSYTWENQLVDHIWTYSLDSIWSGLQKCYLDLLDDVKKKYDCKIKKLGAIGFSAMMHGYMAFDEDGNLLVPFRTWRNTITQEASEQLTELFDFHIPQRWSIAHLYQAMLNKEEHVGKIKSLLTLAGYINWKMTGKKVVGVGEASGMFPIDIKTCDYNEEMITKFEKKAQEKGYEVSLRSLLPKVACAGEMAGQLTKEGAAKLDVTGELEAGIPVAPAEGDAGTGMVATNSVRPRTGNVSAGTSVFGMVVLEKELSKVYDAIDLVTTPSGDLVAMVHCNNCTSDLNAWINIFKEFTKLFKMDISTDELYKKLYKNAMNGDADCGDLVAYNYFSGEHITGFEEGRPLFVRTPESKFTLANFMRTNLYASLSVLKTGFDILFKQEGVQIDKIYGHGGLFKTKGVGQNILAAALNTPVSVMETAGEGGAWGMALLASYLIDKKEHQSLADYLKDEVYKNNIGIEVLPEKKDVDGFNMYIDRYTKGLEIERAAVGVL